MDTLGVKRTDAGRSRSIGFCLWRRFLNGRFDVLGKIAIDTLNIIDDRQVLRKGGSEPFGALGSRILECNRCQKRLKALPKRVEVRLRCCARTNDMLNPVSDKEYGMFRKICAHTIVGGCHQR